MAPELEFLDFLDSDGAHVVVTGGNIDALGRTALTYDGSCWS